MNSGDWVESLTALVEDHEGNWNLMYYDHPTTLPQEQELEEVLSEPDGDFLANLLILNPLKRA